jgi:hypothetical protein
MTEITRTDPAVRELPLAPDGEVEILLTSNALRVHGVDGDRVVVRSRDGADLGSELGIETGPASVRIRDRGATRFRIGPLMVRTGAAPDLDVDVPRAARLSVRTLSGDVAASAIGGASHWPRPPASCRSSSMPARRRSSPCPATSWSRPAAPRPHGPLRCRATCGFGCRRCSARCLDDEQRRGRRRLAAEGRRTISSVGDVRLTTRSGVRLEAQTITGDVGRPVAHRAEGGRGRRTLVVGDGAARVSVRTMSGDVLLGGPAADVEGATQTASPVAPVAPVSPPAPLPPAAPAAPATPGAPAPVELPTPAEPLVPVEPPVLVAEAEAALNLVRPAPPAPLLGEVGPADRRDEARLEILRALERGELDVDAATRRLAALDDAGPRFYRGWC